MLVPVQTPGGIIPFRWAQSSRYGGRLRPESAGMATLFPGIVKFLSKSSEFSARVFTVMLCMITTDTQGILAMTTSLERTLERTSRNASNWTPHAVECFRQRRPCARITKGQSWRLNVQPAILNCSWMTSCIHSISRASLTASATKQKPARRAARLCCLANV